MSRDGWDVLSAIANAFTVLLGVAAVGAGIAAIAGKNLWVARVLRRNRRKALGGVLEKLRADPVGIDRQIDRLVSDRLAGRRSWGVADELAWLDATIPDSVSKGSLTFYTPSATTSPTVLDDLSTAYRSLAMRLRSRILVTTEQVPVLHEEAALAISVADLLSERASYSSLTTAPPGARRKFQARSGAIVEVCLVPDRAASTWPDHVVATYQGRRHVVGRSPYVERAERADVTPIELKATDAELALVDAWMAKPRRFDGVLPALRDWRFERQSISGHGRLHLLVEECSYSSVVLRNYDLSEVASGLPPRSWKGRTDDDSTVPLVTMSLMIVTRDQELVVVKRPGTLPPMGGRWVPSVNGNLEIGTRDGIAEDVDSLGMLDFSRAIVRETREELGLDLDQDLVLCTGLARLWSPSEWGSYVLCFVAESALTFAEIRQRARFADPIEGAYEVGRDFLLLPWGNPDVHGPANLAWALNDPNAAPHLTAALATLAGYAAPIAPGRPSGNGSVPGGARFVRPFGSP